jgi:hypothetical protein
MNHFAALADAFDGIAVDDEDDGSPLEDVLVGVLLLVYTTPTMRAIMITTIVTAIMTILIILLRVLGFFDETGFLVLLFLNDGLAMMILP